jgi:hypothetical protein
MSHPCIAYLAAVACDAKVRAVCETAIVRPGTHDQITAIGPRLLYSRQSK